MRSNRIGSFVSVVVLGIAVLLSTVYAQSPMPETAVHAPGEAARFYAALDRYETRMQNLHDQLNATLPHEGPLTDYQLRLLAEIESPVPYEVAMSSESCLTGGSHSSLVTYVDGANKVIVRGYKSHTFDAKSGWTLRDPTVTGSGLHEISFRGYTSPNDDRAHAQIGDRYRVGQTTTAFGLRGSGRIKVTCDGPGGAEQTRSFGWTLFRECPH